MTLCHSWRQPATPLEVVPNEELTFCIGGISQITHHSHNPVKREVLEDGWMDERMDHTKRQHCGRCRHSSRSYTRVLFLSLCLLTLGPILKIMESISIFMQIYMPNEVKHLTVALSQQCLCV